jgi:tRNA threonylcarbamoyladenosine biosynthesis protein TsaB
MILLALDTSTAEGSVAVLERERVLSARKWSRKGSHSERLTHEIDQCLKDASLSPAKLTALAVGHGPGSFTGIRVAVNAARTLGYTLSIPVFTYDTTELLAEGVRSSHLPVVTMVNAQKNAVFVSTFSNRGGAWLRETPLTMVEVQGLESLVSGPRLCVGDGFEALFPILTPTLVSNLVRDPDQSDFPSAEVLGRTAWKNRDAHPSLVWKDAQALYIRASGAEEKLKV